MAGSCGGGREFACLEAMRGARAMFFDEIVAHAHRHHSAMAGKAATRALDIAALRGDNAYQIAEFYYLAEEFRLGEPERAAGFVDRHNRDIDAVLAKPGEVPPHEASRLKEAIFTPEQKAKVIENVAGGRLRLDQSDLGRFLAQMISPETCRKTVVALAAGGLLDRRSVGHVLVISNGTIEGYFRKHLAYMADAIMAAS